MRRDHHIPRDQSMRGYERGAARMEQCQIIAQELEAWRADLAADAREQAAYDIEDLDYGFEPNWDSPWDDPWERYDRYHYEPDDFDDLNDAPWQRWQSIEDDGSYGDYEPGWLRQMEIDAAWAQHEDEQSWYDVRRTDEEWIEEFEALDEYEATGRMPPFLTEAWMEEPWLRSWDSSTPKSFVNGKRSAIPSSLASCEKRTAASEHFARKLRSRRGRRRQRNARC